MTIFTQPLAHFFFFFLTQTSQNWSNSSRLNKNMHSQLEIGKKNENINCINKIIVVKISFLVVANCTI